MLSCLPKLSSVQLESFLKDSRGVDSRDSGLLFFFCPSPSPLPLKLVPARELLLELALELSREEFLNFVLTLLRASPCVVSKRFRQSYFRCRSSIHQPQSILKPFDEPGLMFVESCPLPTSFGLITKRPEHCISDFLVFFAKLGLEKLNSDIFLEVFRPLHQHLFQSGVESVQESVRVLKKTLPSAQQAWTTKKSRAEAPRLAAALPEPAHNRICVSCRPSIGGACGGTCGGAWNLYSSHRSLKRVGNSPSRAVRTIIGSCTYWSDSTVHIKKGRNQRPILYDLHSTLHVRPRDLLALHNVRLL